MKILRLIKFYLGYAFYVMITMQERDNFTRGELKGMNCIGSRDDSYVIYGSARLYEYENKPPKRNYLTYKQYKKMYYPKTK